MNKSLTVLKLIAAFLLVVFTLVGSVIAFTGIKEIKPMKEELKYGLDINGGAYVVFQADSEAKDHELQTLMNETKTVMERRVNAMGISDANVTVEGKDKIRVELPGVKNADQAIKQIGRTAKLNFCLANGRIVMDGKAIKDAYATLDDQNGGYKIVMKFTKAGEKAFTAATALAASGKVRPLKNNLNSYMILIKLDEDVICTPEVHAEIHLSSCEIQSDQGGLSKKYATQTAQLIKGGALPVSLHQMQASYQSPRVGEHALEQSIIAGIMGFGIVCIIMLSAFGWMGLVADFALLLYVLLDLCMFKWIGIVITLPGIAGIILAIGMAVDANVIIFTRIREELRNGLNPRDAVYEGFKHALSSILDGQITTLIAAIVLFVMGTTTVRGFALTLMIGVILSLITAVVVTQLYLTVIVEIPCFNNIALRSINKIGLIYKITSCKSKILFIKNRKKFYIASLILILAGMGACHVHGINEGIDFSGGTIVQLNTGKTSIYKIEQAIRPYHLEDQSVVFGNQKRTNVIIKTKSVVGGDEKRNIVNSIEKSTGYKTKILSSESFGPSVGSELKHNAILSTLVACLFMFLYICIRFRKVVYGISALMGLVHDVLATFSLYTIFNLTVNNPFIAGILTVIGYSINDTIVIFDRIRENRAIKSQNENLEYLIDDTINTMLCRSLLTSLTTISAILPLIILGSAELRGFALPLVVGISFGTYSSICLCSPILYRLTVKRKARKD